MHCTPCNDYRAMNPIKETISVTNVKNTCFIEPPNFNSDWNQLH